ncbi:MAG: FAD-binding oxidoreductase [Alphaproteobacteria bacterium]
MRSIDESVLKRIEAAVGPKGATRDAAEIAPHLVEWRDRYQGETPLLVRPVSTEEVAAVVKICAETKTPIVPQGGNTGLVGGQVPFGEILLSLSRLNKIRRIDAADYTITVEAGCILADVQRAATDVDRLYPLSLASEGSAEIGGLLSTNAGGINVLRYGTAGEHVLGLEVVLPDGSVLEDLKRLRKDNTGYHLRQLFLGAEGTLGIITAAVLKLWPRPRSISTAFVALSRLQAIVPLLSHMQAASGGLVTAFELVPRIGLDFVIRHAHGARDPLPSKHEWYALIEMSSGSAASLDPTMEEALAAAAEAGLVADAVIAQSETQRAEIWVLRDQLSEVQKFEGGSIKHDVAVPISTIADFIAEAMAAVERAVPGIRPVPFGHVGDGNVHFNLSQPVGADKTAYLARWQELNDVVHGIAHRYGGSISAEHGLGIMKREEILRYKSGVVMELMRSIKRTLDPDNIMNPGKVLLP